jgi:hypothetical protein
VDGRPLPRERLGHGDEAAWITVRLRRQRRPAAAGTPRRAAEPLPEDERGLAVSTLGKVIRRGWDWLGLAPADPDLVGGLIEAPGLAESLTLNKGDFIRQGNRGITYLAYRKAIQEAVAAQLAAWGEGRDVEDSARRRAARPVERDLESVLIDLAEDFPAVAALVDRRPGGQRRLPAERLAHEGEGPLFAAGAPPASSAPASGGASATRVDDGRDGGGAPEATPAEARVATLDPTAPARGPRRATRYGLRIEFEDNAESDDLGRLVESTVWVNAAHPAYRRAVASRAEAYHATLTVAMTLAPLAAEPANVQKFVTAFLGAWGEALSRDKRRRQGRRGRLRRRSAKAPPP